MEMDGSIVMATTAAGATPSPAGDELERGTAVARYLLLSKIGAGGMGVVYAAYDPELDRKVALKLLLPTAGASDTDGRARLLREAQALARLAHPNVVAVHDVGTHGGSVWIAMEFVAGRTLGMWAVERPRHWSEVLRVLVDVARGVAAAHAAGLVHRDLKPDNVMVARDDRVRVMDFGLAHGRSRPEDAFGGLSTLSGGGDAQPAIAALTQRLTRAGAIQGTPAYMAPEQWLGQEAETATDQFGWSVMAWELLYGELPFTGDTFVALAASVMAGRPRPSKGRRVPTWLRRVIERGLASEPTRRWPSMAALLAALERGRQRAWVRAAAVTVTIAVAIVGAGLSAARGQRTAGEVCTGGAAEIAGLWGARRLSVERALAATGSAYAAETWPRVARQLDHYAQSWQEMHRDACLAHRRGETSDRLLDLRMACLERRRQHLAALVDVLAAPDRDAVAHAVQAVAGLPSLAGCRDADALLAAVAPPDDPEVAARVEQLRDELARAEALEGTGNAAAGVKLAGDVRTAARSVGYAPLVAEASLAEGRMLSAVGQMLAAEAALTAVIREATQPGLEAIAAEAAAIWIFVVGERATRAEAALTAEPFVEALIARARDDGRIAALMHNNLGTVYDIKDDDAAAVSHYRRTIDLLQARPGVPDMLLVAAHHNLGSLLADEDRVDEAATHFDQAIAVLTEIHGEHHPVIAHPLCGSAELDFRRGELSQALAKFSRGLALFELYGEDSLYVIEALVGLGRTQLAIGDVAASADSLRRAAAIADRLDHPQQLQGLAYMALAELNDVQGELSAARALSERAVAAYDAALGPGAPPSLPAVLHAAELAEKLGDAAAAERWYERALAIRATRAVHVAVRSVAALGMARRLGVGGRDPARACTLATEAAASLGESDHRRAEGVALRDRLCASGLRGEPEPR